MEWQPTPYTVPLVAAALVSFALGAYATRHRSPGPRRQGSWFAALAMGAGTWSAAYAAQFSAETVAAVVRNGSSSGDAHVSVENGSEADRCRVRASDRRRSSRVTVGRGPWRRFATSPNGRACSDATAR